MFTGWVTTSNVNHKNR